MDKKLNLAPKLVKSIFNYMDNLSKLREDLKKVAEAFKEKKRQEKKLRQKLRKLKVFKQKKLPKLCLYFLADELEPVAKLVQELKDLQEVLDASTTEGKAMLNILNALKSKEAKTIEARIERASSQSQKGGSSSSGPNIASSVSP